MKLAKLKESIHASNSPGVKGYIGFLPSEKWTRQLAELDKTIKKTTGYDLADRSKLPQDTIDSADNPINQQPVDDKDIAPKPMVNKKINESISKKITVKEVKQWMKTLEENRYKKMVNADCKRVAWFVNNQMSEDYDSMPKSYRKRWSEAKYKKEKYLAQEFMKYKTNKQMNEHRVRKLVKQVIKEEFSNGTAKWETRRQQQSEVLGYKLTGKSDIKSKPTPLIPQVGNFKQ